MSATPTEREITFDVAPGLTQRKVAELALEGAIAAFDGAAGMVAIALEEGESLEIIAHRGFPASVVTPFRHLRVRDATPATSAFLRRELEILETYTAFHDGYPEFAAATTVITGTRAVLSVPLL